MTKIKLTLKHLVTVVDEYWDELGEFNEDVTAETIYAWVEKKYNCTIIHHTGHVGIIKEADFGHDKDLTFFTLKHGP